MFLQRSEGHLCTICDEQHFLQERDLATLDNACNHVFCYDMLLQWKTKHPMTLQCPTCSCAATNIYCHKYTPSTSKSNGRISQEFLQRIKGHYCLICHEQHYLTSTDLATFKTEAQCTHVYCYISLLSRMRTSRTKILTCPHCRCIATDIIHHQPIRLDDGVMYNRNISQEVLGQSEGHFCSICHIQCFLHDTFLGTFETTMPCKHNFCYECLSELKHLSIVGNKSLLCPNCRGVVDDIICYDKRGPVLKLKF